MVSLSGLLKHANKEKDRFAKKAVKKKSPPPENKVTASKSGGKMCTNCNGTGMIGALTSDESDSGDL